MYQETFIIFSVMFTIILSITLQHFEKQKINNIIVPITNIYNIPKIIFRTHNTREVSQAMWESCHTKWHELNKDFSIIWFTDSEARNSIKDDKVLEAYDSLIPGAFKADLWRAYMLYNYGGIYVDSYTEPLCSIPMMLSGCISDKKEQFITATDTYGFHNGFIISTKEHPFLKKYIGDMLRNIDKKKHCEHHLAISGPIRMYRSIAKVMKNKKFKIGENISNGYYIYLYEHRHEPYQYIYKNDIPIMKKKFSMIELIKQKIIYQPSTYKYLWETRQVYTKRLNDETIFDIML